MPESNRRPSPSWMQLVGVEYPTWRLRRWKTLRCPWSWVFGARRHSIDLSSVQNPWWLIRAIGDYTTVTNRIENITKHEWGNPYQSTIMKGGYRVLNTEWLHYTLDHRVPQINPWDPHWRTLIFIVVTSRKVFLNKFFFGSGLATLSKLSSCVILLGGCYSCHP